MSDQVPQTKEERGVIGPGRQTGLRLGRLGISQIRPTTAKHITSRCTTYYEVTQDRKLETTRLPHLADPSQSQPSLTSYPAALHIHYNYYISTHWKNSTQKHHNTQQILAWTQERRSQESQPFDHTRTSNSQTQPSSNRGRRGNFSASTIIPEALRVKRTNCTFRSFWRRGSTWYHDISSESY